MLGVHGLYVSHFVLLFLFFGKGTFEFLTVKKEVQNDVLDKKDFMAFYIMVVPSPVT